GASADLIQHGLRRASQFQTTEIEGGREQRVLTDEDEVPAANIAREISARDGLSRARREREALDSRVFGILSRLVRVEEHGLAAGKHLRPAGGPVRVPRLRYWSEPAAGSGNARQCAQRGDGDDVAISPPTPRSG